MQTGVHIVVRGLVQGVGFRYFVYRIASRLNLVGWVRNLYNGDVEVEAEGPRSMLEEFIKDLKIGPQSAYVKDLRIEWQDYKGEFKTFEIH
jgi:acylphosphatase